MASAVSFSGIASGIDSSSLIKALLDQQRSARVKPLENKVTTFTEQNTSFDKLSELLNNLKTSADRFRTINGTALAKSAVSSSESKVSGTATAAAVNGSYAVNVTSLASNNTLSFDKTFTSGSSLVAGSIAGSASDRTVTIQTGQGSNQESVAIEVTSTTTAQQFVDSFNNASSKAEASLINVGTTSAPSYKIAILSNNTGLALADTSVTTGAAFPSDSFGAYTESAASDASFSISGIGTVTRGTNSVGDVIPGLTLNLSAVGAATINVSDDAETSASNVQEFVDAYNEIVSYISENDLITQGEDDSGNQTNVFGPLASTSVDENVITSLRSAFSSAGITGQTLNVLADLGIKTERDGKLSFDQSAFKSAVGKDSTSTRTILERLGENLSAVDGTISQFTRFNGIIDQSSNTNQAAIDDLNKRITDIEGGLSKQEEALRARFARLEGLMGELNQQSTSLASLLPR